MSKVRSSLIIMALVAVAAVSLIAILSLTGPDASAGALLVTTEDDPIPGSCDPGDCSLREAVLDANLAVGPDVITLPAGTYTLSIAGRDEDAAATGDLDILDDLTIDGADSSTTIIQASAAPGAGIDRILDIDEGVTFQVSDITLRHGSATGDDDGGALQNDGTTTIQNAVLEANTAEDRGGAIDNPGDMTIENVEFSQNDSRFDGGAIVTDGGTLSIIDSEFTDNSVFRNGGAIEAVGEATVTVLDSTFTGNEVEMFNGGAINIRFSTVTITSSLFDSNISDSDGGALFTTGSSSLTVNDTTISNNLAGTTGGAIRAGGGTFQITNSTMNDNTSVRQGGGMNAITDGTLTNVTISGNIAGLGGGGLLIGGNDVVTATNVTIVGNTADSDENDDGDGGGFFVEEDGDFTLKNSLVVDNIDPTSQPDCAGSVNVEGMVYIGIRTSGCNTFGPPNTVLSGPGSLVGPLAENGGTTMTHALLENSLAIDRGVDCPPPETDQRGVARPIGLACDLGAYESPFITTPAPTPGPMTPTPTSPASTPSPTPSATVTPAPTPTDTPGPESIFGDIDCDGDVDATDALQILRFLAGFAVNQQQPCLTIGDPQ